MRNADIPAMPVVDNKGSPFNDLPKEACTLGLTKREHFAAMAMQGLLAGPHAEADCGIEGLAHDAVLAADALLSALEKRS